VHIERLRRELEEDPEATNRRQVAARQRPEEDRQRRVAEALEQMTEVEAKKKPAEREAARVSTTDPEARVMKGSSSSWCGGKARPERSPCGSPSRTT